MANLSTANPSQLSLWSTVRFRRAKNSKAWALLGIPRQGYPQVVQRLFEQQAKFLDKYEDEQFVSLLFEAPPILSAKLALTFPAPPGCEALSVAATGDRILAGRAAGAANALRQAVDPDACSATPD
ncbi:MAG: hypothetical protein VKK04_24075 [Synechococcales bacterium]|nr:hypothetical protein [Synechococcales bacterium]